MRTAGLVAVVLFAALGESACFTTARYDRAHAQRVERITVHYDAELRVEQEREAELVAAIERYRARLTPVQPGTIATPTRRIGDRFDILECRAQCARRGIDESLDGAHPDERITPQCLHDTCEPAYVDALARAYSDADIHWVTQELGRSEHAELESLLAISHNRVILQHIDEATRRLSELRAQMRERLERGRQEAITASERERASQIASGRAAHRAHLLAASHASDPARRGPLALRPPCACSPADPHARPAPACRPALAHAGRSADASALR